MFHVQDPRYERIVVRSLGTFLIESCVQQALSLGSAPKSSSMHQAPAPAEPALKKHAASQSVSYLMKQCRRQLELERELIKGSAEATDRPPVSAAEALRKQRQQVLGRLLDQIIAGSDCPSVKLGHLQEMISDATQQMEPDWSFVASIVSASLGLSKLEFGDWSERVAHAELDLAVCYMAMHNFEMAAEHSKICSTVLRNIVAPQEDSTAAWLKAKNTFIAASAQSMWGKSPQGSSLRLHKAEQALRRGKDHDSGGSFPYLFVDLCCTVSVNRQNQEHHQAVCDALDRTMLAAATMEEIVWTHCATLSIHLPLLLAADEELRDLGIQSVKQKLQDEVATAPSKKELDEVGQKLKSTLAALSEKSNALQLCIVRQVDKANKHFSDMFDTIQSRRLDVPPFAAACVNLLRYAWLRCLAIGLRRQDCEDMAAGVIQGLAQSFSAQHLVSSCAFIDIGCALSENDICRMAGTLSARKMLLEALSSDHAGDRGASHMNDSTTAREGAADDPDSDDDATHQHRLRKAVSHYERGVQLMMSGSIALAFARWPVVNSSVRQLSVILHQLQETKKELRWLSLLAALSAETLGPTHAETLSTLKLVASKKQRVHAPLFSPSWGVQQLLTNVCLSCDTADAEIYFSITDDGRGQANSGPFLRFTAPIQLDRVGRVCIRAYAARDGSHSGVVEARFSVVHRSEQ